MTIAYCYASGQIRFGNEVPDGALPLAVGPRRKVREFFGGVARHAYDGRTLLVPGVPEAKGQRAKMTALRRFYKWILPMFPDAGLTPAPGVKP